MYKAIGANIFSSLKYRILRCLEKDTVSFCEIDTSRIPPRISESEDYWNHCLLENRFYKKQEAEGYTLYTD
jgi:hypothetical protein